MGLMTVAAIIVGVGLIVWCRRRGGADARRWRRERQVLLGMDARELSDLAIGRSEIDGLKESAETAREREHWGRRLHRAHRSHLPNTIPTQAPSLRGERQALAVPEHHVGGECLLGTSQQVERCQPATEPVL